MIKVKFKIECECEWDCASEEVSNHFTAALEDQCCEQPVSEIVSVKEIPEPKPSKALDYRRACQKAAKERQPKITQKALNNVIDRKLLDP